jgi:hypothetical protein
MEKKAIKRSIVYSLIALAICYSAGWLFMANQFIPALVDAFVGWIIAKEAFNGFPLEQLRRKQFLEELSRSEHFERLAKVDQMLLRDLIDNDNH